MCGVCERVKETREGKNPFLVNDPSGRAGLVVHFLRRDEL